MILNSASPSRIPTVSEQLLVLRNRRSVVDRLIRCLETYQRVTPVPAALAKARVA